MLHHGTIKKYVASLLDIFGNLEIQYTKSTGAIITKNIPIRYSTKEKSKIFDEYTTEQIKSGNTNVLPRASLSLSSMIRGTARTTNKNVKLNTVQNENNFEFVYNSVPYDFTFELVVQCRGMNEALMIVEQVVPLFNPIYNIDIFDVPNLSEPTRVPISLLDISIEDAEYDEFSSNIFNVNLGLELKGNIYPPIKTIERIKEFKMYINEQKDNEFTRKTLLSANVIDSELDNIKTNVLLNNKPTIIDLVGDVVIVGDTNLQVIYEDLDNKFDELTFTWDVITGDATIVGEKDNAILTVNSSISDIEVQITITDIHGNYSSLNKIFTI